MKQKEVRCLMFFLYCRLAGRNPFHFESNHNIIITALEHLLLNFLVINFQSKITNVYEFSFSFLVVLPLSEESLLLVLAFLPFVSVYSKQKVYSRRSKHSGCVPFL